MGTLVAKFQSLRSVVLVTVLLLAIAPGCRAQVGDTIAGKVVAIQDGDTLTLLDADLRQHRIRISGIDAPERAQPYGSVSQANLSRLAFLRLVTAFCPKMDRYGRQVCTVWVDGVDVGLAQIEAGLAWHYKQYAKEQSDGERQAYTRAEEMARAGQSGIWHDDNPIAPWEWRHRRAAPRP